MTPDPLDLFACAVDRLRRPVWLYDPQTQRGVYANPAAVRLWGAESLGDLLARDFSGQSPAVRARTDRLVELTAGGAEVSERWTFYPQGRPFTVEATISAFRLHDGRDVLLFEASPAEVGEGERRAVEALRHTSAAVTLFSRNGQRVFANPAAYRAYGASERRFSEHFIDAEAGRALLEAAADGTAVAGVYEVNTTGGPCWHFMDARPVTDPVSGEVGVLLNEQDVTARVEAERSRAAAEQRAAMADSRQRFLTEMSHELRTPLNAVIGFSHLLTKAGLPPTQVDHALRIHRAGERLIEVVNQMIELSEAELPPQTEKAGAAAAPAQSNEASETRRAGEDRAVRVLYVDDNESNRTLVRAMLATQGIPCETAEDGLCGVEAAANGEWSLILMDIQMPVMDGVSAARRIRGLPGAAGEVPIVALTANTLDDQVVGYLEAGMDDCIAKPVDMVELLAKTAHWAGSSHRSASRLGAVRP